MSGASGLVPPPPAVRPSASAQTKPKPKLQRVQMRASYRGRSVQIDLEPISQEVYTWQALKSKVCILYVKGENRNNHKVLIKFLWCGVSSLCVPV